MHDKLTSPALSLAECVQCWSQAEADNLFESTSDSAPGLYAVVDACQAWPLLTKIRQAMQQPLRNLFKGAVTECAGIETVAPTLVPLTAYPDLLTAWMDYIGQHAGMLIKCRARPAVLFRHLRRIFIVTDEQEQEHFFRFYDPRVLRVFLPACTPDELLEFFGPIDSILIEGVKADQLEVFQIRAGRLECSILKATESVTIP